ncbi:MAG TPA: hypothetical protein VFZ93_08585 [Albitalea sp.]
MGQEITDRDEDGMNDRDDLFYARWILANGVAEGIGLGITLSLAHFAIDSLRAQAGGPPVLLGALLAVAMGTLLQRGVVGWAQGVVLRSRTPRIAPGAWALATAAGVCLAWVIGALPGTVQEMRGSEAAAHSVTNAIAHAVPDGLLPAASLGLALGVISALPQWGILTRSVPGAWRWPLASGAAWGAGMTTLWIGMDLVPWHAGAVAIVASLHGLGASAGIMVGAVNGWVLTPLLSEADAHVPESSPRADGRKAKPA